MAGVKEIINVIGAGPAGLVAAINLAKADFAVMLHESAPSVGHRFHGDFQGIENWTTEDDVENFSNGLTWKLISASSLTEVASFSPPA